jgi:hypothetical protein
LRIPSSINNSRASLAEFAAQVRNGVLLNSVIYFCTTC